MRELPDHIVQALEDVRDIADAAVALLDRYDQEYRVPILVSMLVAATGGGPTIRTASIGPDPEVAGDIAKNEIDEPRRSPPDALGIVAAAANVDQADLRRIVQVTDDGAVKLLPSVAGRSMAERANRAVAVYCFIKEHGFEQLDVGVEELRGLCIEQGAYNSPNFTRNLRKCPWLLEIGDRGSRDKQYRLSPQGEESAKVVLRELLEG